MKYGIISIGKQKRKWVKNVIKFIVIEDEKDSQDIIRKVLRKVSIEQDEEIEIKYFDKYCKELEKIINEEVFRKIYILDIELKGTMSGIEIAKQIRNIDWDSEIIFVTSHDKMFESVHRNILDVFDFIEKFHEMNTRLEKDIKAIIKQKFDKKMLRISSRNVDLEIYLKNILYITRDKEERKLIIHTKDIDFKVTSNFTEIIEKLDNRFIRTHRGCIANIDHVVEYNYKQNYFRLDNGKKVDLLSKKYRKEVEKCLTV